MSRHDLSIDVPTPDQVRAALERIVVSDVFRSSPQLASFLSYVVEAVLHGKSDRIKGYTIGVEVLRRDIKFDPQLDPIVRVEATRLRRALERYYTGPGLSDAVIIRLPRGSYVPTFNQRIKALDIPEDAEMPGMAARRHVAFAAAGTLLAILLASVWVWTVFSDHGNVASRPTDELLNAEQLLPGNGMPTLLVDDLEVAGPANARSVSAATLQDKLRDAFSRFDAINIATKTPNAGTPVNYRLRGFIDYLDDGTTSIRFSLLDVSDGNVVWTHSFPRLATARDRTALEETIVTEVTTSLLQPFGLIRSRERTKYLANGSGDPRYRCLLLASDSFRSFDPATHKRARACLERLIVADPGFANGFSFLAVIYNQERSFGFGPAADDPSALDIALKFARRGVELNPNSARAWHILGAVQFNRRDNDAAITAIQKAMTLNPYDTVITTDYGGRLINLGEIERGMAILESIPNSGGVQPLWQHFYLFLGNYMRDKLPEATHEADEMTGENFTFGLFARALTAAANGNNDKAQNHWSKLIALRSAWRDNPRGELERFIPSAAILDRLMRDLAQYALFRRQ